MRKKESRRRFIKFGAKIVVATPLLAYGLSSCKNSKTVGNKIQESTSRGLKILILGGSSFLGPHQIAYALGRGHEITTFTRGKTKPTIHQKLFEQVEQLIGDRNDNLTALENRKWDAVIDNSGHKVEWTRQTAELLKDNCDLYLYTSSTGVFYPYINSDFTEESELVLEVPAGVDGEMKMEYDYGVMKALSEIETIKTFGEDRSIIVRPTYMIGPADRTNRFIHWPIRLSKGGEILVPGKPEDKIQYLDVRDAAEWMIRLIEDKKVGTYNAPGPKEAQDIFQFVEEASGSFDVSSSIVKIDDYDFLKDNGIYYLVPWIMPEGNNVGSSHINNTKAFANGLTCRSLTHTVRDTYNWWYSDGVSQEQRDKIEKDPKNLLLTEASIIEKWKNKR